MEVSAMAVITVGFTIVRDFDVLSTLFVVPSAALDISLVVIACFSHFSLLSKYHFLEC
jgi:hypothetical protein